VTVYLDTIRRYDVAGIEDSLSRSFEEIGFDASGRRTAIIKPNLVIAVNPKTAIVTHPAVTEAVINVLRGRGLEEIAIAEGPGVGSVTDTVFEATGYRALADRLGVRLIDFNAAERREREWKYGRLAVPAVLEDADLYVNIPKLKTHGYTTVTLSIKNHKGMLAEEDKKLDHHLGLHDPLAQQARLRPPDLIVVDGIVGMHHDGPLNGRPLRAGIFAVGTNMVEVDGAVARLMGFDPEDILHLRLAAGDGLGTLNPETVGTAPCPKVVPANEEYGRLLNIYSWRDCTACSMCIDSFTAGVRLAVRSPRYWFTLIPRLAYWGVLGGLHVIQGREAKMPGRDGRVICLGKCTAGLAKAEGLTHIPGCPPTAETVARVLRKEL